jgi:hypothetical protein
MTPAVDAPVAWPTEWPADERAAAQLELKRFDSDGDGG